MSKKALIVANDSINTLLYDEVHTIYDKALKKLGFDTKWASTTVIAPMYKKENSVKFDELITTNLYFELYDQINSYDFVFISMFSVDQYRQCYVDGTIEALEAENIKLKANVNDYYAEKVLSNIRLIKIADYCRDNDIPYICYTFDPMLDTRLKSHTLYSFLDIPNVAKKLGIFSNIESQKTNACRIIDLSIAYNENLPLLVDIDYINVRVEYTKHIQKIIKQDNVKTRINITQYQTDKKTKHICNDASLSSYQVYTNAKKHSKFTLLMPNYDGMTWSFRRFFEDVSVGCIPIAVYSDTTQKIFEQLPQSLQEFYEHTGLYCDIDELDSMLSHFIDLFDENYNKWLTELQNIILDEQKYFTNIIQNLTVLWN